MSKKIVFCGGGNMAEGVIRSLISTDTVTSEDIAVSEIFPERCEYLKKTYGVQAATDVTEEIGAADVVVIAVLPHHVESVAPTLKNIVKEDAMILSIAAGVEIATVEAHVGKDKKVARVMPNTLNQSHNGYSAVCLNANFTEKDKEVVTKILNSLGQTMYLEENMFNNFTAFSCAGPLWVYQLAEALIDAGVYLGFNRQAAKDIVVKNILGVGQVLDTTGEAPKTKINEMCSPRGVTIEGFKSLQEEGFSADVFTSVCKTADRANSI
ncbi:pyrroline-5-carboxylate reductase [Clostridiales Family XIII bacterium PM5-7]